MLLVDDHAMFREGLRFTLSREPDLEVAGEATDGAEAIAALPTTRPDVVVMDLAMPVLDGLAATPAVVAAGAAVLVLTLSEEDANVLAAMRAGAAGYLVKGVAADHVASAVRAVASGHAVFGPTLATRMLGLFAPAATADPTRPELSDREHQVLELIAEGLTNAEIAERLSISPVTARNHVSNILDQTPGHEPNPSRPARPPTPVKAQSAYALSASPPSRPDSPECTQHPGHPSVLAR